MCAQAERTSASVSAQADDSVRCPLKDDLDSWLPKRVPEIQIRLCGDAEANMSLRWAHIKLIDNAASQFK